MIYTIQILNTEVEEISEFQSNSITHLTRQMRSILTSIKAYNNKLPLIKVTIKTN